MLKSIICTGREREVVRRGCEQRVRIDLASICGGC